MCIRDTVTGMVVQKTREMEPALFVGVILVSSQNVQVRHLRELDSGSLYNQDMIGAVCLDFVKLFHKCLDYSPGKHIH